ncbi:MAG: hypothetical protein MRY75_06985 [Marivita sp.]|uniref:hypothetical protein n=1 Tax=Marivita sp. TaxID=2003365 RepID=UPI0025BFB41C|nr:hypothetical protein [Marivita sp.]MCI5110283.1 hypothetical protein [Marivita sp.]
MGVVFDRFAANKCCLCGSTEDLSGEHKIKASLIRSHSRTKELGFVNPTVPKPTIAQSAKSKAFHFKSKICKQCNSERTQKADRAFDAFHHEMLGKLQRREKLWLYEQQELVPAASPDEIDRFRYFAKLLVLFLADVQGPRPKSIAAFAIAANDQNPILLSVAEDELHKKLQEYDKELYNLSHGGLTLRFNRSLTRVLSMESSLSAGGLRYDFWINLKLIANLELQIFWRDFLEKAKTKI